MSDEFQPAVTYAEVQADLNQILGRGLSTLAWLFHDAEDEEDDLTMLAILNEVEHRGTSAESIFHKEYKRLWPAHSNQRKLGSVATQQIVAPDCLQSQAPCGNG